MDCETLSEAKDTPAVERDDDLVDHVYLYLRDSAYPKQCSPSMKRQIRLRSKKFELRNGELYYRLGERDVVRYIQNQTEQHKIALACHADPTSGHVGVKKTIARIKERFTWKGLVEDVKNIVSTCDRCQKMNSKLTTATPELHPVPVQSPWFHLGMDFIGPISPVSSKGNLFILTISDYFTKWVEAVPLPTKESSGVAQALMRANGLDERWNQTLKTMIVKYAESKKELWDEYVDSCVFAYNTSSHESSLLSPFEVMFGRKAVIPIELSYLKPGGKLLGEYLTLSDQAGSISELKKHRLRMLEIVIENISTAQAKQKLTYDRKHARPCEFQVGALVLRKDFRRKKRKGGKMDDKWLGPLLVSSELGKGFYSLSDLDGKSIKVKRINGAHLKPYKRSSSGEPSPSTSTTPQSPNQLSESVLPQPSSPMQMTPSASPKQSIAADTCDLMNRIDSSLTRREYRAVLSDQLHSSHLMRMWRTGALMMAYTADEDEDFDPTTLKMKADEFAISKDLNVALWEDFLHYNKKVTLKEIYGGDFLIINEELHRIPEQECSQEVKEKGLQNTTLGSNLSFDVVQRDFVQILHNGTNHWVSISNLDAQPSHCNIYDSSMFHSVFDHASVADQICALMHSSQPMITVHHANVDKQKNGHDCGVYAIAFATSLCYGQDVMSIHYDNHKMRQHLVECLEGAKMLPFPSTYEEKSIRFVKSETIDLFCHCRGPDSELMIQCD
ncbi:hypothetical protein EMCRGX_G001111 [Ephydatia muelleri]